MRTGFANLPLHPGKCPKWLFSRMKRLSLAMCELIIDEYGTKELLNRISDPFFFQAFGCAIAFDWHSSGLTTTTCGALKEALTPELGIAACGGKGKTSRDAPYEIETNSTKLGTDNEALKRTSLLCAKVDNSCIQDGYSLYHHSFFFDASGNWAVVQQGMNNANKYARRYHWFNTKTFVDEPPEKIAGDNKEPEVLNLVSGESEDTRRISVDILNDNPAHLRKYFDGQTTLFDSFESNDSATPTVTLPDRHQIERCDLTEKDWRFLQEAYEFQPKNYQELVCLSGMGARKLRALALVSKLVYGTKLDWVDPVKYSFTHGGKDGIPFPVDRNAYENTISFLRNILLEAKCEQREKETALKTLAVIR